MKRFRFVIGLLILAGLVLPTRAVAGKSYRADRFDVEVFVQPDGALLVTETVVFQFDGGPYTYAFRQLSRDETDGIEILGATMDGVELPAGTQAGQVEIDAGGDPIDVRWHFEPTSDRARTFRLQYRVLGTTRSAKNADQVKWFVIPADHEYEIRSSTVTVHLPAGKSLSGAAGLTGADWKMKPGEGEFVFTANDIGENQPALLTLPFPSGSLLSQPPAWQAKQLERARQARAAFPWAAGLGLVVLISGLLWLGAFWRKNHPAGQETFARGVITRPPNELSPALAGALLSMPAVPFELAVATLLDLARRGRVRLDQIEKSHGIFSRDRFRVVREETGDDAALQPHEQMIFDLVFGGETDRPAEEKDIELPGAIERLQRGLSHFSKTIIETMLSGRWVDDERREKHHRITAWSAGWMILFILLFLLSLGLISTVGVYRAWIGTLVMGVSIPAFVLSIVGLVMAGNWGVLSGKGLKARDQWQGFAEYLKTQIRSNEAALPEEWLDAYLPYAVALRFGDRWAGAFQERGLRPQLAWLRAAGDLQAGDVLALMTVISSSSSSGGGGGGGGGGASGAG